jgi:hypothetical protein
MFGLARPNLARVPAALLRGLEVERKTPVHYYNHPLVVLVARSRGREEFDTIFANWYDWNLARLRRELVDVGAELDV